MTKDEADQLRYLLQSPLWVDVLEPRYNERLSKLLKKLAMDTSLGKKEANVLRGEIRALHWVLNGITNELHELAVEEETQKQEIVADAQARQLVEYGHGAPFMPLDER